MNADTDGGDIRYRSRTFVNPAQAARNPFVTQISLLFKILLITTASSSKGNVVVCTGEKMLLNSRVCNQLEFLLNFRGVAPGVDQAALELQPIRVRLSD